MLNFIIYDDEKAFLDKNKKLVDNFMMKYDYDYKCYLFQTYDDNFEKIIKDNMDWKIFLLDIEGKNKTGMDIARIIREKYDDWSSVIIMITNHNEFKYDALGSRLYLMDFINKLDNWEGLLTEDIQRVINNYTNNSGCLTYEYNHNFKRIEFKNIVYIEKEKDSKKCIIYTLHGDYPIYNTICGLSKLLDNRFIKTSRSTIINFEQMDRYDKGKNKIIFYNGMTTTDISRQYKKAVIQRVNRNSK